MNFLPKLIEKMTQCYKNLHVDSELNALSIENVKTIGHLRILRETFDILLSLSLIAFYWFKDHEFLYKNAVKIVKFHSVCLLNYQYRGKTNVFLEILSSEFW